MCRAFGADKYADPGEVRFWHLADIDADAENVRSWGKADIPIRAPMSANDPKRTFHTVCLR